MPSIEEQCSALPANLDDDDVLVDCATVHLDAVDVVLLVGELLRTRRARSLTLLGAQDETASQAVDFAASLGMADRLKIH